MEKVYLYDYDDTLVTTLEVEYCPSVIRLNGVYYLQEEDSAHHYRRTSSLDITIQGLLQEE